MGSVVIAGDRLHTLVHAHHKHHEYHGDTIGDAIGTYGEVAAEAHQLVVHEDDHHASANIHQERRYADGKDMFHEFFLQSVDASLEVEQFVLVAEEFELPHQCHQLREDGGDGGSSYSPFKTEDEERIEYHVHNHRKDGGKHRLSWFACCPQQGVHAEVHVAHHVAQQDDDHILMGIKQRLVAGSEESEDRVEKEQADDAQSDTNDKIQCECVAQNVLGSLVVLLSQLHADGGRGSHAHAGTEGGGEVHERESDGETRDSHRSHTLADEHTVNDVVERSCGHRNHRWQGILHEELAYRFCS